VDQPAASVIIRAHDSRADLEVLLPAFRAQTAATELIVVDSGSADGSQAAAERLADRVLELAPGSYSPGRALNAGVEAAVAPILFAFSSHCRLPGTDWVERALRLYDDPDVGAVNGSPRGPDGERFTTTFLQDAEHARANPQWGFSNHASSWRRAAWEQHRFDEEVTTAEDRLWAIAVTAAGWRIAYDPELWVDFPHRWQYGTANYFRRQRRELIVIGSNVALPDYPVSTLLHDWWHDVPHDGRSVAFHRFVNYRRTAGKLATYLAVREARRIRRSR
jgi:glycosyltransferase involved in cell wall biosynthesis